MKKTIILMLLSIILVAATGCSLKANDTGSTSPSAGASGTYQTITPADVKQMMDNGDDMILVDVRTVKEYNNEYIEGAINIPVETLTDEKPAQLPDTDAIIILYCRTGARSKDAAQKLTTLGYTNVYDMGGIVDWPYETISGGDDAPSADQPSSDGVLSAFTAFDIDGNTVDESILSGYKLTMVNIWGTFCSPCISEMPELGALNAEYADKGVQVIGIVIDVQDGSGTLIPDMVDFAKEIVDKTGADYLHILPSADLSIQMLYRVEAVPTTIFVDEFGRQVGEDYLGARSGDDWKLIVEELLTKVG